MFFRLTGREPDPRYVVEPGEPLYRALGPEGLQQRAQQAWQLATSCQLCGRRCLVNRLERLQGYARLDGKLWCPVMVPTLVRNLL